MAGGGWDGVAREVGPGGFHRSRGGCVAPQAWVKRGVLAGVVLGVPRREAARLCCSAPLEEQPSAQPGRSNQVKLLRERKGVFLCKICLHPGKDTFPQFWCLVMTIINQVALLQVVGVKRGLKGRSVGHGCLLG